MKELEENAKLENLNGKTVLYMSAPWCSPCRGLAPILDKIESKFDDITFIKIDVDKHPNIAEQYDVQAVPTLVMLDDTTVLGTKLGAHPQNVLEEWLGSQA